MTQIYDTFPFRPAPQKEGTPPTLKRTDKTYKPIYMTAAMIMTVLLSVTVRTCMASNYQDCEP